LGALRPTIDDQDGKPGLAELVAEADALRAELHHLESENRRAQVHHDLAGEIARILQSWHQDCERALASRERAIQEGAIRLAGLAGQLDQARASLPDPWRDRLDTLTPEDVRTLAEEWEGLRGRRVEEQAEELPRARERAEQARRRLEILDEEIGRIPAEARCEPSVLAAAVDASERAAADAEREERDAAVQAESLRRAFEAHRRIRESAIAAEREHQVADTLARLLGRDGLQRTLLRQAEIGILACANPILRELSGDELQLRAAEPEEGESEPVFALEAIENIGGTTQVQAVEFLSGSQRFRVAVALALGIGRYARGLHRPIESVIIDEGFGSLDRHGRHEMIEQLRSLRGSLARILLVSHQDEFIDAFQDGYRFERIDGRTVVSEFHR
jgi:exonuclease SbcC